MSALDERPGLVGNDRMSWVQFALLCCIGIIIWVGGLHIARDVYRWLMGIANCE